MKQIAGNVVELLPNEAELVHAWYCYVSDEIKSANPNWRSEFKNRSQWLAITDALKKLGSGGLRLTWEQWAYYHGAHLGHPDLLRFEMPQTP